MTQYVYLNDTVTFECTLTNLSGYFISRGAIPPSLVVTTLANGGTMLSFSLTATNQVNGTDVTCYTINGAATETAYVYVQGQ